MNRYRVAALAFLSLTACERRIDRLDGDVCPDGYVHVLGESCGSTLVFGWGVALLVAAFWIYAVLRMFAFMSTVESELRDIRAAVLKKKD